MRLGVHVSIDGGFCEALRRAKALRCDAMQVFSSSPQNWQRIEPDAEDAGEFKRQREKSGVYPLAVHVPYLINLSSPDDGLYKKSIESFIREIGAAEAIGADYLVTHLGSHKGRGESFGIKRFAGGLNIAIGKTRPGLMVLLETTAGSGDSLGHTFAQIRDIIKRVAHKDKVAICLDTAHVFAAGYDIATKKGLSDTLKEFDRLIGLKKLKIIHLNDSKGEFSSRVDRHHHIGKGKIGLAGMKLILKHPKLRGLTFILETPKDSMNADKKNLALVRRLAA